MGAVSNPLRRTVLNDVGKFGKKKKKEQLWGGSFEEQEYFPKKTLYLCSMRHRALCEGRKANMGSS